uniref:Uncharacterized protein n=1 Tax=Arabidopsis thaliana TaxID=3702 RepID=Q8LF23_ARATH|nr:unknown [Arabidopsis thaliana]
MTIGRMIKLWSNAGNGGAPWWTYWSVGITIMVMGTSVYEISYAFPAYSIG